MKTRTLTILQADLVGSTDAASNISRQEMTDYIEELSAQIIHAVRFYGGDPFKFTGDGYLASFESASDCLSAAQKLQRDLQLRNLSIGGKRTAALRVIVHTADLVVTEDDVLGDGMATGTLVQLEFVTSPPPFQPNFPRWTSTSRACSALISGSRIGTLSCIR